MAKDLKQLNRSLRKLGMYIQILNLLIPDHITKDEYDSVSKKQKVENYEGYRDRLSILYDIIARYEKYIKPKCTICSIVDSHDGNFDKFVSFEDFDKNFNIVVESNIPRTIQQKAPIVLFVTKSTVFNSNGVSDVTALTLHPLVLEKIALQDAQYLFVKSEILIVVRKMIQESTMFDPENRSMSIYDKESLIRTVNTLLMHNCRLLLISYHSFLDKFSARVIEIVDEEQYSKSNMRFTKLCVNSDIISRIKVLLPDIEKETIRSFQSFTELRNRLIHDHNSEMSDYDIPSRDRITKLQKIYEDIARDIWKKYFNSDFPDYIKSLNKWSNHVSEMFQTQIEAVLLSIYTSKYSQLGRDVINKIITQYPGKADTKKESVDSPFETK